jgi:papain like cysteine protease AvrRpt2
VIGAHRDDDARYEPRWDASVELGMERQIGLNWCWAAVAKGIVDHYGGPKQKQCQYATKFLQQRRSCCRGKVVELRCDAAHDVDSVLMHCGVYASPPFHRPVSLDTLRRELERDRPVVALVQFPATVHALAITAVDVANRRIGVCDPWWDPKRKTIDAGRFERAYDGNGRWFYTILTRPRPGAAPLAKVSLLRDRMPHNDPRATHAPHRRSEPLEISLYQADPHQLALGTGLQRAERFARDTFRLDVFDDNGEASLRLDVELTKLREDVEARLERGFELRIVRCFALKFEALWFTDPADPSHRADHYIPVPRVPYYLDEGREYGAVELREILVKAAELCMPSIETNRTFVERLAREAAFHPDDPTM